MFYYSFFLKCICVLVVLLILRVPIFLLMKPPERVCELEDNGASVNTEVRFLTLELMKLAARKNVPFEKLLAEYIENTCTLKHVLSAPFDEEEELDAASFEDDFKTQKHKKKA